MDLKSFFQIFLVQGLFTACKYQLQVASWVKKLLCKQQEITMYEVAFLQVKIEEPPQSRFKAVFSKNQASHMGAV